MKSAQVTISEFWPDHVMHKTVGKSPEWDEQKGIVCACGEVLGWPVEDPPEDLEPDDVPSEPDMSTKEGRRAAMKAAQEKVEAARRKVDAASETRQESGEAPRDDYGHSPAVITGAFGNYPTRGPMTDVQLPEAIADDDCEDQGLTPMPDPLPDDGMSYGLPEPGPLADEVTRKTDTINALWEHPETQAAVAEVVGLPMDVPTEFAEPTADEAQSVPFPAVDWSPSGEVEPLAEKWSAPLAGDQKPADLVPWDTNLAEPEPEVVELGTEVVPFAGVPIFPTEDQELDPLANRLPALDPTLPYTPADVELKIVEILQQLENSERFLRQQLARQHQATHNHDLRYNLAIHKSDAKAADQRKAEASIATASERYEMTEADALVRALRDSQHNLRSQLSGFQSVARSLGVSLTNALDGRDMPVKATARREPPEPPPWEYQ